MGFQLKLRRLFARTDGFFELLEQQADLLEEVAHSIARVAEKRITPDAALSGLAQSEQLGDALLRSVVSASRRTYLTPLAREDIHRLSTAVHCVLQALCRAGQALTAYEIQIVSPATHALIRICNEGTQVLKVAVRACRHKQRDKLTAQRLHLKALEHSGESAYRAERAALYKSPQMSAKHILRQQAILDALCAAIAKSQNAAVFLEKVVVKHG